MSLKEPVPFSVQKAMVLHGGFLKKPLTLECEQIESISFVTLSKKNPSLALALGHKGKRSSPFAGTSLIDEIVKKRNDAVDQCIVEAMRQADPMAEAIDLGSSSMTATGPRSKLFHEFKVPSYIGVTFDAFVTPEGKRVPAHTINVVSTPKKLCAVAVEATAASFDWLVHALKHDWATSTPEVEESTPIKRKLTEELEEAEHLLVAGVKAQVVGDDKVILHIGHKRGDLWTRKQKSIRRSQFDGMDAFKNAVASGVAWLAKFGNGTECDGDGDDQQASDQGCNSDSESS